MNACLLAATASAVALAALPACAPPPPSPATAAPGSPTSPAERLSTAPVISAFQIIDDVTCSGSRVSVPVSWETRNVAKVVFAVDGLPTGTDAYPTSGVADVSVPCDGRAHTAVLHASGPGGEVDESRQVNTIDATPPAGAPLITQFDVLDDVSCTGATVDVAAAWLTQNAQTVTVSVDGRPLSGAARPPLSGIGRIAVPCDGKAHVVTLTAAGTGPPASLSRSVNTTA